MASCAPINSTLACATTACETECLGFPICGGADVIAGALVELNNFPQEQATAFAALACLRPAVAATSPEIATGLNTTFLLFSAYLIFFMQAGFAMLCAGAVRSKNTMNILIKNVVDACVGSVCFYLLGFGVAYGANPGNPFIGDTNFALSNFKIGEADWSFFVAQWAFVAATASIVSGSVAERTTFWAYLGYCSILCSFVYPCIAHWCWSKQGWISPFSDDPLLGTGLMDFGGSGVVHMTGGFAGLMGAIFVGPRIGRFDMSGAPSPMPGHSATLVVLGTFCLWFGWYGFNPGAMLQIDTASKAEVVGRTAATTTLAAGAGGLAALIFRYARSHVWNLVDVCNGVLCGLVAVTAGCSTVEPWAAILIGAIGALIFTGVSALLLRFRIDDPLEAAPMHGACGMWGVIAAGLMATPGYTAQVYGQDVADSGYGLFYGGGGRLIGCQIIAVVTILTWTCVTMGPFFYAFKLAGLLRCAPAEELQGLDVSKHGGHAYYSDEGSVNGLEGQDVKQVTRKINVVAPGPA